ncbi:MAG: FAD-binding oxidoreductase [Pseudomonadota bacterium]
MHLDQPTVKHTVPNSKLTAQFIAQLINQLSTLIGPANVLSSDAEMAPYLSDWRGRYQGTALCVARPANSEQVSALVRACAQAKVPMLAQGGNTSLCGGATPDNKAATVVISLARMNSIRQIDPANGTLTAEAGCVLATLQTAAEQLGYCFPLSLASEGSCHIGGNLSTNAGGVHVIRYGNSRALTLGLEVVLPNGDLWNGLRSLHKDNSGYDLKQLFIGAEGTLGIITAAVLRLFPKPTSQAVAWLALASPEAAIAQLTALQQHFGPALSACELISADALALVLKHIPQTHAPLPNAAAQPWHLLIELSGYGMLGQTRALADALTDFLHSAINTGAINDAVLAESLTQARQLWLLREQISAAQSQHGPSIKHDISLPISALPSFMQRAETALRQHFPQVRPIVFGHVGDGNLHYNLSLAKADLGNTDETAINHLIYALVEALGGSISAEHGIGQLKRERLLSHKSTVEIGLMRQLKKTLDPHNLMNPGKLL